MTGVPIIITGGAPPRGGGTQADRQIQAKSLSGTFSWGNTPGTASLV
jgi:hypothetical protein